MIPQEISHNCIIVIFFINLFIFYFSLWLVKHWRNWQHSVFDVHKANYLLMTVHTACWRIKTLTCPKGFLLGLLAMSPCYIVHYWLSYFCWIKWFDLIWFEISMSYCSKINLLFHNKTIIFFKDDYWRI